MGKTEHITEVEIVCGIHAFSCVCGKPPGHEPPHECANDGGQWVGEFEQPNFKVIRFPITIRRE